MMLHRSNIEHEWDGEVVFQAFGIVVIYCVSYVVWSSTVKRIPLQSMS